MLMQGFRSQTIETSGARIMARVAGDGPPLLLLHGYPQTHVMWHPVAPALAEHFTVVCTDLRGYGDSDKPPSDASHAPYSKRAMAGDQVEVMAALGFRQFYVAGHDRGARVVHRMALDHPDVVRKAAVLDIIPTWDVFERADKAFATAYYHWFFLIQSDGLPEHLIGLDPEYYLRDKLRRWSRLPGAFDERAVQEYLRCFRTPEVIHASCEDYRAAAGIDLDHDSEDLGVRLTCPLLALWGERGFVGRMYDVPVIWGHRALDVTAEPIDCGHFLVEEQPLQTLRAMKAFFGVP